MGARDSDNRPGMTTTGKSPIRMAISNWAIPGRTPVASAFRAVNADKDSLPRLISEMILLTELSRGSARQLQAIENEALLYFI